MIRGTRSGGVKKVRKEINNNIIRIIMAYNYNVDLVKRMVFSAALYSLIYMVVLLARREIVVMTMIILVIL